MKITAQEVVGVDKVIRVAGEGVISGPTAPVSVLS